MKRKLFVSGLLTIAASVAFVFLFHDALKKNGTSSFKLDLGKFNTAGRNEEELKEEEYSSKSVMQEFKMLRNPVTGKIPDNIHQIELEVASKIPSRGTIFNPLLSRIGGTNSVSNQNAYQSVGPNNVGGRSRALGIDKRNASIMITGGTTGGIFRSADGGGTWTFVSPENDIRSVNSIAQDPASPDTWYVGTGEVYYPVSTADIAGTVGFGIFKSTDNGLTWTKLISTQTGSQHTFDGQFDLVHRLAVHPTTRAIYAAVHNRIMKSTDGGATWATVLGGTVANSALGGLAEVLIPSSGSKIFAAFTGENADRNLVGVWESTLGDASTWTRIAGGISGQADSIAGWQPYGKWGRVVLALNSTNTKLFVLYKNGKSASGSSPQPEADLFSANISSGTPSSYVWSNLSAWVPDEANYNEAGIDPYTTQFNGFNMSITVKPDNDNILFIGGTVLERVNLAVTDQPSKFRRVGGYGKGFIPNAFFYPNHHPDVHGIYFPPGNADQMYTVSDGGVHKTTTSVMADTVQWQTAVTNLQTLQYQFVNIYPDTDADWVIGGAQDNGTYVNLNAPTDLAQQQIGSGDGSAAGISRFAKNGNTWKQYWYLTVSQSTLYRSNFTWQLTNNTLNYVSNTFDDITPSGFEGNGQWRTLLVLDPDSTEHLYYNNGKRIFRTTSASTVTSTTWTEMTGVAGSVLDTLSAMDISKRRNGIKYLFMGTEAGHVYRLDNANLASPTTNAVNITPPTMTASSYVAAVAINPRSPDTVMVVVSNYDAGTNVTPNIFWTGNATSASPTWQVIDGALEPLSVQSCAIVVKTTGVEYYVGTSVGLYSATSISGNSTTWLQEGSGMMKTAIIRSLVNRQLDNTLVVGTHGNGAFISSIGNAVTITDVVTGINPITNDKNFISSVYPTLSANKIYYTIGNMFAVKKIRIELLGINGQQMYVNETSYQNGAVDVTRYAAGSYLLNITSDDGKYRYIQKVVKH